MTPDPNCIKHHHLVNRDAQVFTPGDRDDILDYLNKGWLLFIGVIVNDPDMEVRVQLDGQPEPSVWFSPNILGDMGLDEPMNHHLYIERWDPVASRYALAYNVSSPEPFGERVRVSVRNPNPAGGANMSLLDREVKVWIVGPAKAERGQ